MSKLIDLTGQKFGKWTVLKRAENGAAGATRWLCECECGTIKSVPGGNLRNGSSTSCGCDRAEKTRFAKGKTKNEVGNRYGSLIVLEWQEQLSIERKSAYWLCQCDCGNKTIAKGTDLRQGKIVSCGCKSGKRDRTGERYGMLTVLERVPGSKYLCQCDCGNTTIVQTSHLTSGAIQSCGCIHSIGERTILQYFLKNNISYIYQYINKDIKYSSGKNPRFDFALLDKNKNIIGLIEYQGNIHYNFRNSGWNTEEHFKETQKRDQEKRESCQKIGIPLFEIPYWELENIEQVLQKIISSLNMEEAQEAEN